MTWMQRLKRVFSTDIEICQHCRSHVKVVVSIEDPAVIEHILKHLRQKAAHTDTPRHTLPPERARLKPGCSILRRLVYSINGVKPTTANFHRLQRD